MSPVPTLVHSRRTPEAKFQRRVERPRRYFFKMDLAADNVLTITIKYIFDGNDVDDFAEAIGAKFSEGLSVKRIVVTAVQIEPIRNAAGRILDLAVYCNKEYGIPVLLQIPAEIYARLQEITPNEMESPPVTRTHTRNIDVEVFPSNSSELEFKLPEEFLPPVPTTTLSCVGKVRAISEAGVTVSLFIENEEVIGEMDRSLFPPRELTPGLLFDYQILSVASGRTEIVVNFRPQQEPSGEDLMDIAKEIGNVDPFKDYRKQQPN